MFLRDESGKIKLCPICKGENLARVRRSSWMRLLGDSKRFKCPNCGYSVLRLGTWAVILAKGGNPQA